MVKEFLCRYVCVVGSSRDQRGHDSLPKLPFSSHHAGIYCVRLSFRFLRYTAEPGELCDF